VNGLIDEQESKEQWIRNTTTEFLLNNAPQSIAGSVLVVAIFSWVNQAAIHASLLCLVWLLLSLTLGVSRIVHFVLFRKKNHWLSVTLWRNSYRALAFLSGVSFGSVIYIFFEESNGAMQLLSLFIVLGMTAGAVGTHSVDQTTFRLFIVPVVIPSSIYLIGTGEDVYQTVAAMFVVFGIIMDRSASQSTRSIRDNFEMTYAMRYRATHDPLVGLFNRAELEAQFETRSQQSTRAVAMLFVDLDDFKPLNDTLGHQAGDKALKDVANIIKLAIRADDVAARLGGDEFVVLLFLDSEEEATLIAKKILQNISEMKFSSVYNGLSASIGIGFNDSSAIGFSRLMRIADIACYESKNQGKNTVSVVHNRW